MRRIGSKNRVWLSTAAAAAALDISPRQLRTLREDLKFGLHYRSISRASAARQTYQWDVDQIFEFLNLAPYDRPVRRRPAQQPAAESD